jgi:hypothetical protein
VTKLNLFDLVDVNHLRQLNDSLWRTVDECLIETWHGLTIGATRAPSATSGFHLLTPSIYIQANRHTKIPRTQAHAENRARR